ncbi:MAG: protoporphyrinogen oxidase [Bryobacterales bacterium]|nr:protoporphyrinogen oxidase [Bryobacterales bacterium]
MNSSANRQIVIVGGGVSGLSAAHYLLQAGLQPLIIEKQGRFGGLIRTDLIDGCELEAGPDSFIAAKPAVASLAAELGITGEIIGSNDAARRVFIVKRGKLVALPAGMVFMVPGDLDGALRSDFFSQSTKDQFLRELALLPRARQTDVSIREFVLDHFGEESLEYLTEPLLSGVYGGDSAGLSAPSVLPRFVEYERKFGSLIRAVREERAAQNSQDTSLFLSFRGGMQTLTDALHRSVLGRASTLEAEVDSVEKTAQGWRLHFDGEHIEAENLVLACPAHVNAHLLRTACPELARQFASIPYSSALLVTLVYDRSELHHPLDGFGFLVPRPERYAVAAATWVSTKFPSRTPADRAAVRAFIVGAEAAQWMTSEDSELIDLVREEYRQRMGISAVPLFSTIYRWPNSMPQYTVGHEARKAAIEKLISVQPGLHFCGNAYDGVGIPDCIRMASELPEKILTRNFGLM